MKSIGFNNFRRFHKFPEIELGDITFLVGGNNSGKSTLVKALLLCAENVVNMVNVESESRNIFSRPKFNFDSKLYNGVKIKSFARALNNNPSGGKHQLFRRIIFYFSYSDFNFEIRVAGDPDAELATADIVYVSIEDTKNNRVFEHDYEEATMTFAILHDSGEILNQFIELLGIITKEKNKLEIITNQDNPELEEIAEINNRINVLDLQLNEFKSKHKEFFELLESKLQITDEISRNEIISKIAETSVEIDRKNTFTLPLHSFRYGNTNLFESVIDDFITVASLLSVPEEQKEFVEIIKQDIAIIRKSRKELESVINAAKMIMPIYISAHAATQNALYSTADLNDYNALTVHEYFNSKIFAGDPEYNFIIEWMKNFGIGSSFEVLNVAGEAYQVKVKDDDGIETHLADKGMGSIQLMILLLRMATIIRKYHLTFKHPNEKIHPTCPRIVIEEPEQNLHPAMQSKLAELFLYLNKKYNCKFLIETHSEYLIRKTQVIVAQQNYEDEEALKGDNSFKVYYFNSEEGEQPCYEMEYSISGAFKNQFGTGFFDEAAESDMVIIRKEHELKKRRR